MFCSSLPCGQPNANRWTKRLIEARRCLPPLKCPVAWKLLLIAKVKKCFITILLLQLPCQPPFLGPWGESVSSLLPNANSDFGLILGFFSCHGWNIYLPPAGCFKQAAICWDIHRACGEQAQQICSGTFFLDSENVAVCSAHKHTSAPSSLLTQRLKRKYRYFSVETETEIEMYFSLKYLKVSVWNVVTIQPTHDKAVVFIWSFMDCFCFTCTLYLIFFFRSPEIWWISTEKKRRKVLFVTLKKKIFARFPD